MADSFPKRTPSLHELGMTQKEATHLIGQLMDERARHAQLSANVAILSSTVADVVNQQNIQHDHLVNMTMALAEHKKYVNEHEHPLKYQVAATRNDITAVSGSVQKLAETVTKLQGAQVELGTALVRFQGLVGIELPNTVELHRYRSRTPTSTNVPEPKDLQQAPMIAPAPQRASSSTDEKPPMHHLVRKP